jgi:hypothetical protein
VEGPVALEEGVVPPEAIEERVVAGGRGSAFPGRCGTAEAPGAEASAGVAS